MIGLVIVNLKRGYVTSLTALIYILICAAAGFIVRSPAVYGVAVTALMGGAVGNFILSLNGDSDALWQMLEATMPIKSALVELSKFLAHIVVLVLAVLGGLVYTLTNYASGVLCSNILTTISVTFSSWIGWFLLTGAIVYLLIRLFGLGMASVARVAGFIIALTSFVFLSRAAHLFNGSEKLLNSMSIIVPFGMFVVSYLISLLVYRRKLMKEGLL